MRTLLILPALLLFCLSVRAVDLFSVLKDQDWESGYIGVGLPGDNLFYFLVRAISQNESAPLIIWLNGGPGCSSMFGMLGEHGPMVIDRRTLEFKANPYSWNQLGDVLYLDQPVGVGFSTAHSFSTMCTEETCVGRGFMRFFTTFLEKHPEYIGRELYLAGESYAGHYIPTIGRLLIAQGNHGMRFKGVAIGNPDVRMPLQLQTSPFFLFENSVFSLIEYLLGKTLTLACLLAEHLELPPVLVTTVCYIPFGLFWVRIPNPYDIRETSGYDTMEDTVEIMLRKPEVQSLLGVNVSDYKLCDTRVELMFVPDLTVSSSRDLELILESGVDVMLYFGNKDNVCSWRGGEELVESLNWNGSSAFVGTQAEFWMTNGTVSGTFRKYRNLNLVVLFEAGHMVPLNQPLAALTMVQRFIRGEFQRGN